jgi:NAD(P)-dependent dehydrogenase (short-subunit alcohol dehydrogenase family)
MAKQSKANKVALITGANKGIGLEIARQLGRKGITVLIGARDDTRGQEAANLLSEEGIDARFVQLDVTDQTTIDAAAADIGREFGRLDILVNNAAIFIDDGPPSKLGMDALRRTYDTNFFGQFANLKAMLPLLRKSDAGRIVNMSSGLGSLAQTGDPKFEFADANLLAYNSSKTALNAMTVQFANELRGTAIKINSADPGYVATDMNNHGGYRTVEQGAKIAVHLATLPADGPSGGFFNEDGALPW